MTHRDDAAVPAYGDDGIVALRSAARGVDHHPDSGVHFKSRGFDFKHRCDVCLAENLLQGVEGQASKLGLDEVLQHNIKVIHSIQRKTDKQE